MKDTSGFVENLMALASAGHKLEDRSKLLELNKARVAFKHYGILPASGEAVKFQTYAEDFLRSGMRNMFDVTFDTLSVSDLVAFQDVREHLKEAERLLSTGAPPRDTATELAVAKAVLFGRIARHIPNVDGNLGRFDSGAIGPFKYIASYLTALRDLSILTLMQIPLEDYTFLTSRLPVVHVYGEQQIQTRFPSVTLSDQDCWRILAILVGESVRLEGALQAR